METFRWIVCLLLGIPAALLILGNWLLPVAALVEMIRTRSKESRRFSFIPLVGGVVGAVACLICPAAEVRYFAWLPLVLEPLVILFTLSFIFHVIARIIGLRSPFDPDPPSEASNVVRINYDSPWPNRPTSDGQQTTNPKNP